MTEIINPYIAGSPIKATEMFFGREDVFEFVQQTLIGQHQDNIIVLYGQRRTGKTSILYQMQTRLDPHYLCVFVDLHGLALEGINGFLWELTNHIYRALKRDHHLDLPRPDRAEFQADPRGFFESKFLTQIWSAIGDRHLLLMVDEAIQLQERVAAGKLEAEIFKYLCHLMQHHERLNFLFSLGSGLEVMEQEYAFLFRVGLYKKISFLDLEAAIALITQPVKEYYQVETAAVGRILHITSAHAYYTQLLCHCLFNHWLQHQQPVTTVQEVNAILEEVVELGLAVLKYAWEESTPGEKAVLVGMATAMGEANRPVTEAAIQRVWDHIIPEKEFANATRNLIARDVIVGQSEYRFTVDLLRLWIQKYERLEWVKEEIKETTQKWTATAYNRPFTISRRKLFGGMAYVAATGVAIGTVYAFARPQGQTTQTYHHSNPVTGVAWSPDGSRIVSSDSDGKIKIWDPSKGDNPLKALDQRHITEYTVCCWSPDGKHIATGGRAIIVWNATSGREVLIYRGHTDQVRGIAWSKNGYIASGGYDGTVQVWNAMSGQTIKNNKKHTGFVYAVTWSPDGRRLASGSSDKTVIIWDLKSDEPIGIYKEQGSAVEAVAWSPNKNQIASGDFDSTVKVWDVTTHKTIKTYRDHTDAVRTVKWSPDGKFLASGGDDSTVRIWDGSSDKSCFTYTKHNGAVSALSWSPDGRQIASGSKDNTVQVWNASNYFEFGPFRYPSEGV